MSDQNAQTPMLAGPGKIALGVYLFLVTVLFAYVTAKLWPPVGGAPTQTTGNAAAPPAAQQPAPPGAAPAPAKSPQGQPTTQTTGNAPAPPATQQPVAPGAPPAPGNNPQGQTTTQEDKRLVQLFWAKIVFSSTVETRLILLVLAVGALGGCIHAATSFAAFAGREELHASWVWWYLLRVPMSGALALVAYFAVRGGFFSGGTGSTASVNDFGIAAMAGLVGMFTKQATAKLDEVFTTLFRTATPPASGGQPANKVPTVSSVNPAAISHGSANTTITVTGDGFVDKSEVRWAGVALTTQFVKVGQLTATVPAEKLAAAGSFDVTVFNPPPGGGTSAALKVTVTP